MWSFNDSGGETLLTDCLALSVFSLNTALHQTRLYTHTHTHTEFHMVFPHGDPAACIQARRKTQKVFLCLSIVQSGRQKHYV